MRNFLAIGLFLSLILTGCGGGVDNPPCSPVTGTITRGTTPVANADVVFHPQGTGDVGKAGTGKTDANGKFTISTYGKDDGALVGKHHVTVVAGTDSADIPNDSEGLKKLEEERKKSALPETFREASKTPIQVDVDAESSKNNFTWDLDSM